MITVCHKCGRIIEDTEKDFLLCKYCNAFTPRSSNSYLLKGGNKMVKEKTEVQIKTGKRADRLAQAQKIIDFMDKEGIDVSERSKVLSGAYHLLKKN